MVVAGVQGFGQFGRIRRSNLIDPILGTHVAWDGVEKVSGSRNGVLLAWKLIPHPP